MTTISGTDIATDHSVADIDDVINLSADKDGSIDHSELIQMILVTSLSWYRSRYWPLLENTDEGDDNNNRYRYNYWLF